MIRKLRISALEILEAEGTNVMACAFVNNVGYEIMMPERSYAQAQKALTKIHKLSTHTTPTPEPNGITLEVFHQLTETSEHLFGFFELEDHLLYTMFLEVSGVGKKTALSLVQELTLAEVKQAVLNGKEQIFARANGVGKKTSERVFISMKSQLLK